MNVTRFFALAFCLVFFVSFVSASTPGPVDDCQVLNTPGEYTLARDLSFTDGSCFEITSNDVVLDGNGYTIQGSNFFNAPYTLYAEAVRRIEVKDLNVESNACLRAYGVEDSKFDNIDCGKGPVSLDEFNRNEVSYLEVSGDSTKSTGISLQRSSDNLFVETEVSGFRSDGILIVHESSNNRFVGGSYSADEIIGDSADVSLSYTTPNNVFLDADFDSEILYVDAELIKKWYLDLIVRDSSGNAVEGASVEARSLGGDVMFSGNTGSDGEIDRQELAEYISVEYKIRNYLGEYTITASKDGVSESVEVLMDQNKEVEIVLDLEEKQDGTILSGCQTIKEPGRYVLEENLEWNSKNRRCIDIRSDDVTLDCRGNSIVNERTTRYAIRATKVDDVTIQNCKIETPRGKGIRLYRTKEAKILDNEFEVRSRAISLVRSTKAVISDNSIIARNNAVHLYRSNNNDVSDNEVGSKKVGFRLIRSNNNDFTGNFIDAVKNFVVRKSKGNAF